MFFQDSDEDEIVTTEDGEDDAEGGEGAEGDDVDSEDESV